MTKKKGAQPRNRNALKHGIYSQFNSPRDVTSMRGMSDKSNKDELAMARVGFQSAMIERLAAVETKEQIAWDMCCQAWLNLVINAKAKAIEQEQSQTTIWDTFMDAVRAANDKQGFHR